MIKLMYRTGLRVKELVNVKHKNIFYKYNYVKINGKGDKKRDLPIENDLGGEINSILGKRKNKHGYEHSLLF